jgi:hypothetical protein
MLSSISILRFYYAATAAFLLLDYAFDVNLRLAFLEPWPGWRALYYAICFSCLGLIVWRPDLTLLVTTVESLITLSALLLSMGARVLSVSVNVPEMGGGFVTVEEIINFVIAGGAAWLGWFHGSRALHKEFRQR